MIGVHEFFARLRLATWAWWYIMRHGDVPVLPGPGYVQPSDEARVHLVEPEGKETVVRVRKLGDPDKKIVYAGKRPSVGRRIYEQEVANPKVIEAELEVEHKKRGHYDHKVEKPQKPQDKPPRKKEKK